MDLYRQPCPRQQRNEFVYAFEPTEEEMLQIKAMLGRIFANRLTARVDQAVKERGITDNDLDRWLNDEDQ